MWPSQDKFPARIDPGIDKGPWLSAVTMVAGLAIVVLLSPLILAYVLYVRFVVRAVSR